MAFRPCPTCERAVDLNSDREHVCQPSAVRNVIVRTAAPAAYDYGFSVRRPEAIPNHESKHRTYDEYDVEVPWFHAETQRDRYLSGMYTARML